MRIDEINRIKARIEKCQRRIKAGYSNPEKAGESEEQRLIRLQKRLQELESKEQ